MQDTSQQGIRLERQRERERRTIWYTLTQVETRLASYCVIFGPLQFLAESWKKQMFISSLSSAFIYIYVPFREQVITLGGVC